MILLQPLYSMPTALIAFCQGPPPSLDSFVQFRPPWYNRVPTTRASRVAGKATRTLQPMLGMEHALLITLVRRVHND